MLAIDIFSGRFFGAVLASLSGLEIALGCLVLIFGFMIWVLTRHTDCSYDGEPEGSITERLVALAGLTQGVALAGNDVSLVQDAEYFDRFCAECDRTERVLHFEMYLWKPGKASDRVTESLCAAARRGVKVRVLADARGTSFMGDAEDQLREAGCQLAKFHRWRLRNLGRFNVRDHRKVAIFDGKRAMVGGHCVSDDWLEDVEDTPRFRDVSAVIEGPVVGAIQSAFAENWQESTRELFVEDGAFPTPQSAGETTAHVAYVRPDGCSSAVQVLHYVAIALAKKTIRIQNPYFLPDPRGWQRWCAR